MKHLFNGKRDMRSDRLTGRCPLLEKLSTIILFTIFVPSLCQYAVPSGLRPDVTFGEDNERYDITNIIRRQTKHFKPNLDHQSEEFRRRFKSKHKKKKDKIEDQNVPWPKLLSSDTGRSVLRKRIKDKLEDHVNNLANTIINKIRDMRRNDDFAYHDKMDSEGGGIEDFNTNLRAYENRYDLKENEHKYDGFRRKNRKNKKQTKNNKEFWRRQNRLQNIVNKLHGDNETRRMAMDPEREILFHYAFPVDMKIEGFLQAPFN